MKRKTLLIVIGMATAWLALPGIANAQTGTLQLCKIAGVGVLPGTEGSFTVGSTTTSLVAGPGPTGNCVTLGPFTAGTNVTVTEAAPALAQFTLVTAITSNPPLALVSSNLAGRTAVVNIGSTTTTLTFTNTSTVNGELQVCKVAGTGIAVGTPFTFSGFAAPITAGVAPTGNCATRIVAGIGGPFIAIGLSSTPVRVSETIVPGTTLIGITSTRLILEGGAASGFVTTQVSNGQVTTVTFTNAALVALAVRLRSFTATKTQAGYALSWRTASEVDVLGFNVYGDVAGRRVKLNKHLIAARASNGRGSDYRFAFRPGAFKSPRRFSLQVVNLDGSRTSYTTSLRAS